MVRKGLVAVILGLVLTNVIIVVEATTSECTPPPVNPADYDYPPDFPPFQFGNAFLAYGTTSSVILGEVSERETPIAVRIFSLLESMTWNCVAAYDEDKHDAFDMSRRPIISTIPPTLPLMGEGEDDVVDLHSTAARVSCLVHVYAAALPTLLPQTVERHELLYSQLGYGPFTYGIRNDVMACTTEADPEVCLNELARCHNYKPEVVASAIAWKVIDFALNDGWNMDGRNGGKCETNCRPYADTTGYTPVNIPGSKERRYRKRWQPLLEDDGKGFFYRQEHVTPQIGTEAKTRVLTDMERMERTLDSPNYKYKKEVDLLLERLAGLTDEQKMEIEFFENKAFVVDMIGVGMIIKYGPQLTFERVVLFNALFTMSEHNATIVAWKEKVNHDRVRPTTVIQDNMRYGTDEVVTTWAGPGKGTQTFKSKYFQPYIRVMPHSEYPSGSGCICQSAMELSEGFMKRIYGDASGELFMARNYAAGSSKVEPGQTPATDIALSYSTLEELRNACGQSRLNGGMHFTASVPDSYKLCEGIGIKAASMIDDLLNGSDI